MLFTIGFSERNFGLEVYKQARLQTGQCEDWVSLGDEIKMIESEWFREECLGPTTCWLRRTRVQHTIGLA